MFVREFVKRKNEVKEAGKSACSMQVTMTEEMQLLFPIKERTLDSKAYTLKETVENVLESTE
jgi:hypothetical protein